MRVSLPQEKVLSNLSTGPFCNSPIQAPHRLEWPESPRTRSYEIHSEACVGDVPAPSRPCVDCFRSGAAGVFGLCYSRAQRHALTRIEFTVEPARRNFRCG